MTTARVKKIFAEVDQPIIAALNKGEDPQLPAGADPAKFWKEFLKRNPLQKSTPTIRVLAQALGYKADNLMWGLQFLIELVNIHLTYERAVQNNLFLHTLRQLQTDIQFYLRAYAESSVTSAIQKDYEYYSEACNWDIRRVNQITLYLAETVDLIGAIKELKPTPLTNSPVDILGAIEEALPEVAEFKEYFPEFCMVANEKDILCLTDKVVHVETPKLELELPTVSGGMEKAFIPGREMLFPEVVKQPNVKIVKQADRQKAGDWLVDGGVYNMQKAASDFHGFFIAVVSNVGSPEDRDLHGHWTSKEENERACDRWALNSGVVGIGHKEFPKKQGKDHPHFVLLRNWIQYGDAIIGGHLVKDGTWLQAYQCVSEWFWML